MRDVVKKLTTNLASRSQSFSTLLLLIRLSKISNLVCFEICFKRKNCLNTIITTICVPLRPRELHADGMVGHICKFSRNLLSRQFLINCEQIFEALLVISLFYGFGESRSTCYVILQLQSTWKGIWSNHHDFGGIICKIHDKN